MKSDARQIESMADQTQTRMNNMQPTTALAPPARAGVWSIPVGQLLKTQHHVPPGMKTLISSDKTRSQKWKLDGSDERDT